MNRRHNLTGVLCFAWLFYSVQLFSQEIDIKPFSPLPFYSFTMGYSLVDFKYSGAETATVPLTFTHPVLTFSFQLPTNESASKWGYIKLFFATGKENEIGYNTYLYNNRLNIYKLHIWVHRLQAESRNIRFAIGESFLFSHQSLKILNRENSDKTRLRSYGAAAGIGLYFNSIIFSKTICEIRTIPFLASSLAYVDKKERIKFHVLLNSDIRINCERIIRDKIGLSLGFNNSVENDHVFAYKYFVVGNKKWYKFKNSQSELRLGISW